MSVVHVKSRSTSDEQKYFANSFSDQSLIWASSVNDIESFSIEFYLGNKWSENYGPTGFQMLKIDSEDGLVLEGHGSIVVDVDPEIKMPHNIYGVIVPTGSLFLDKGILIAPAKIEPSFRGRLKLRLFNTTAYKHTLRTGDKLASAIFYGTETTSYQEEVVKQDPVTTTKKKFSWAKFWGKHHNLIVTSIATILASVIGAAITLLFTA